MKKNEDFGERFILLKHDDKYSKNINTWTQSFQKIKINKIIESSNEIIFEFANFEGNL